MIDYHEEKLHWTSWQRAIAKWPSMVWEALAKASACDEPCEIAAIDGTTHARSNPSKHYLQRIASDGKVARPVQQVTMIDVQRRKFLSWRIRAEPKGEKCDVPYLIQHSSVLPELVLMDKGFDSNPLHEWLREQGIWSIAPVRKKCNKGRFRKQLRDCFDWCLYWQRNIIESMFSAIKRLYGVHLRARTWKTQRIEIYSRLIAYNIRYKKDDLLQSLFRAYFRCVFPHLTTTEKPEDGLTGNSSGRLLVEGQRKSLNKRQPIIPVWSLKRYA